MARTTRMPAADEALPGRSEAMRISGEHHVSGRKITPPYPDGLEVADFALGCFWGAERLFWKAKGVWTTAVGYAGGLTPNPTYEEVCSGRTGHAEVVRVVFDPAQTSYADLLKLFWEEHDPTQGMRQGNDIGTQYRSALHVHTPEQRELALGTKRMYEAELRGKGLGPVTTEVLDAPEFYFAEEYHQQYLSKNPGGYCGLAGTGVSCPMPLRSGAPA